MIFQKFKLLINKGGSPYEYYKWSPETVLMDDGYMGTCEFDQPHTKTESKMQVAGKISSNK